MNFLTNYIQAIFALRNSTKDLRIGPEIDDWNIDQLSEWLKVANTFADPYIAIGKLDWIQPYQVCTNIIADCFIKEQLLTRPQVGNILDQCPSLFNSALNIRSTILCYLDDLPFDHPSVRCQCAFALALPMVFILDMVRNQMVGALDANQYKIVDPFLHDASALSLTLVGKCVDIINGTNTRITKMFETSNEMLDKFPNSVAVPAARATLASSSAYLTWLSSALQTKYPQHD
ncbi:MAG: hypothetical protein GXO10_01290 [Crenarchaeota archaeon]|nr:hypothetical protein [Thermoproteota archaeon]